MNTLLRLLGFLRPYRGWVVVSVLLGLGTIASAVGLMGTSAYLIARAAQHPSVADLQVAIVGVRFFGLARGLLRYLERLVSHSVNFRLLAELRVWFYRAVEPARAADMLSRKSGDLLNTAVSDIETLENFYVRATAPILTAALATAGVCLLLGGMHPLAGWILAGGMLLAGAALPAALYFIARKPAGDWTARRGETRAFLVESLQGLADLSAAGRLPQRLQAAAELDQAQAADERRLIFTNGLSAGAGFLIMGTTMVIELYAGSLMVRAGELEGVLLAVICLVTLASFEAVLPVQEAARQMEKNLQAGRRLFSLPAGDAVPGASTGLTAGPAGPKLELCDLSFEYDPGEPVLRGVSLELAPGKRVAVVGASGTGKTTLVKILLGLWEAPAGAYLADGLDSNLWDKEALRRRFAVVSQTPFLFSASVRENLLAARPDARDDELRQILRQAGLGDWLDGLPRGLDAWIGEDGLRLSGGERQRLTAARALLRNAPFLILDEPLSQVDAAGEELLSALLAGTGPDRAVLWITHRLQGLDDVDEILFMEGGRVVERGTYQELTAKGAAFARLRAIEMEFLPEQGPAGTPGG